MCFHFEPTSCQGIFLANFIAKYNIYMGKIAPQRCFIRTSTSASFHLFSFSHIPRPDNKTCRHSHQCKLEDGEPFPDIIASVWKIQIPLQSTSSASINSWIDASTQRMSARFLLLINLSACTFSISYRKQDIYSILNCVCRVCTNSVGILFVTCFLGCSFRLVNMKAITPLINGFTVHLRYISSCFVWLFSFELAPTIRQKIAYCSLPHTDIWQHLKSGCLKNIQRNMHLIESNTWSICFLFFRLFFILGTDPSFRFACICFMRRDISAFDTLQKASNSSYAAANGSLLDLNLFPLI